jgi:Protein of unknown function (DUF3572)
MRQKLTKRKFASNLTRLTLRKRFLSLKSSARDRRDDAEATAVAALGFLAADPERLSRFVALSGLDVAHLRLAAQDEGFLAGIMAYVVADDALLLDFAATIGRKPEEIASAHHVLNPDFEG